MRVEEVIELGKKHLQNMEGHIFDVLSLSKPVTPAAAISLSPVVSKLSPLVGNMIEINATEYLNDQVDFQGEGRWVRQDPGFPDIIFEGVHPNPGFEIKAWFPLATEMTGRFKDSQNHFQYDETYVALFAWLPEHLLYGKPNLLGICVVSGWSVAKARDDHYHNPPDYIVLEPEDTTERANNLKQTNTSGYKFQGNQKQFREAQRIVESWGANEKAYKPTREYQKKLRELTSKFSYRQDTNYAKIDRIEHNEINDFIQSIYSLRFNGKKIANWKRLLASKGRDEEIRIALANNIDIREVDPEGLLT